MIVTESRAYLCGFFTNPAVHRKSDSVRQLPSGWSEVVCPPNAIEEMKDFYYSDFIDFIAGSSAKEGVRIFERTIDRALSLPTGEGLQPFTVPAIRLYLFPFGIVVFSVEIRHREVTFDALVSVLNQLRNNCYYDLETMSGFIEFVIGPLCEVYERIRGPYVTTERILFNGEKRRGYPFLMENGNKFKLFHILVPETYPQSSGKVNILLYEAATLSREVSCNGDDFMSCSPEYFESVIASNKISIFNNWKALSLFDTFTILSGTKQDYLLTNWEEDYFGKIYLYGLFRKFYLFRMNTLFRREGSNLALLKEEFILYERKYCFPRVSYNFLPLEIMKHITLALDIDRDKEEMYHMLEQENQQREEIADRKMNNLLFFLTCLTIFSTVWDLGCLLDSMYPFELAVGSTMTGFRSVTSVLLLVTILFAIFNRMKKH